MLTPDGAAVLKKHMPDLKSITFIEQILFKSINLPDI
jgi:hypothetical protein